MIEDGEFLEHAIVYGEHKGVPKAHIRQAMASGKDAVMRVDVQGAETVKGLIPAAVTVFLTCESEEELVKRLLERRTETKEQLQQRLETVRREMKLIPNFDYVVVNHNNALDDTVDKVIAIIQAEHCRAVPQRILL
jgi:guanylate kinase